MTAGVLALQGDFEAHAVALRRLGVEVREVRRCRELEGLEGLVLPGGESTSLLRLMEDEPWFPALRRFHDEGGALLGTCAGAILLARVVSPAQPSLGLLDAEVERNAFGRQADSFVSELRTPAGVPMTGVFIRAPRFRVLGPKVEVLARLGEEPVLVRAGRVLAATFHPELTPHGEVHRLFLEGAVGAERRRIHSAAADSQKRDGFSISTDPALLDLDVIHGFLAGCYWARDIPRTTVERSLRHSLCFGLFEGARQAGFCRVISDFATFAYLADVFVLPEWRGRGLSKWMMQSVRDHPDLQGLRRFLLGTRDAHGLYAQFGFAAPCEPSIWMEIHDPHLYERRPSAS